MKSKEQKRTEAMQREITYARFALIIISNTLDEIPSAKDKLSKDFCAKRIATTKDNFNKHIQVINNLAVKLNVNKADLSVHFAGYKRELALCQS